MRPGPASVRPKGDASRCSQLDELDHARRRSVEGHPIRRIRMRTARSATTAERIAGCPRHVPPGSSPAAHTFERTRPSQSARLARPSTHGSMGMEFITGTVRAPSEIRSRAHLRSRNRPTTIAVSPPCIPCPIVRSTPLPPFIGHRPAVAPMPPTAANSSQTPPTTSARRPADGANRHSATKLPASPSAAPSGCGVANAPVVCHNECP